MSIDPHPATYSPFVEKSLDYDAFLLVSFGGPEGMDDVIPFLENVLRGRNVPPERMQEVAHHYEQFGGMSPINAQNRALLKALQEDFQAHGLDLPLYWGNRNWHPLLPDTLREMQAQGHQRVIAFFTSIFSSYSGCRQYRENIFTAQQEVGEGAPVVDKLRMAYNHPLFIEANAENVRLALDQIPAGRRANAKLIFTAHSIPMSMANNSAYVAQLHEAGRLVAEAVGISDWTVAYQSRSGSPQHPWLEPDISDVLSEIKSAGYQDAVVLPLGFVSDHMEVIYDLDTEAQEHSRAIGLNMVRAATVGTHPKFVQMIRELVLERMSASAERIAMGNRPPNHDICPPNCCLPR